MCENNNGKSQLSENNNGKQHWVWNITLILAIISGAVAFLWGTYCDVYFRSLSFPHHFFSIPSTFMLKDLIAHIILFNLPILLICLAVYAFMLKESFPCKTQLWTCLLFTDIIFIVAYIPFVLRHDPIFREFYYYIRHIGIWLIEFVHNPLLFFIFFSLIILLVIDLAPDFNLAKTEIFKKIYIYTTQDKLILGSLVFILIFGINYAAIVLLASHNSESLIKGSIDHYVFSSPDLNNTNLSKKNLTFVIAQERAIYLVVQDPNFNATDDKTVSILVLNADKLNMSYIKRVNGITQP